MQKPKLKLTQNIEKYTANILKQELSQEVLNTKIVSLYSINGSEKLKLFCSFVEWSRCVVSKIPRVWLLARANDFASSFAFLRNSLHTHAQIKSRSKEKNFKVRQIYHLSDKFFQTKKLP